MKKVLSRYSVYAVFSYLLPLIFKIDKIASDLKLVVEKIRKRKELKKTTTKKQKQETNFKLSQRIKTLIQIIK